MFWGLFFFVSGKSEVYFSCADSKNCCCRAVNHCGSYKLLSCWEHLPSWGNIASVFPGGSRRRIKSDSFLLNSQSLPVLPFLLSVIYTAEGGQPLFPGTWFSAERTMLLQGLSSTPPVLRAVWNHSHQRETSPDVHFITPLIAVA